MANFAPPPGTGDIFPAEAGLWQEMEEVATQVFGCYGYGELRTPIFEYTEVFQRGLGNETEVVRKEMYTFTDRGGRSLTLRPEGTAGVMRALLNTDVLNGTEQRVFYHGPMFRGERPAAGRRRQFHQVGAENVGRCLPELDAEVIAMLMHFLSEFGLTGCKLKINTRGLAEDRPAAEALLRDYFAKHIATMCPDCQERFNGNLWRILDCKNEHCHNIVESAPDYVEAFSTESREYFQQVLRVLDLLNIEYEVDPLLVRGLDYYVHTVWEVTHDGLGAQTAIAGGGRYELFLPGENRPVRGVGFAAGMERLLLVREALKVESTKSTKPVVFVAALGSDALAANMVLTAELRKLGATVLNELEPKSMKSQMRSANRLNAQVALVRGDSELAEGTVIWKDMAKGEQCAVSLSELPAKIMELYTI